MDIPNDKIIEGFIHKYVTALSKIVEEKQAQIVAAGIAPSFPTKFPVEATVYLTDRGLLIHFVKAPAFGVSVKKNERPSNKSEWGEFMLYAAFDSIKDKPEEKAEADIKRLFELSDMLVEKDEADQAYYDALWFEEMQSNVDYFIEFLGKSSTAVGKTKTEALVETHEIVTIIQNFMSDYEFLLINGCKALDTLYFLIESEMETSFFLALHGRYTSAMARLRTVLEVMMRCIYLDCLGNRTKAQTQLSDWIINGEFKPHFPDVVKGILDDQTDQKVTTLLSNFGVLTASSLADLIKSKYRELCSFVHMRPNASGYDLDFLFPDFSKTLWSNYYNTFILIANAYEALLILKFPKILSSTRIASTEKYTELHLPNKLLLDITSP